MYVSQSVRIHSRYSGSEVLVRAQTPKAKSQNPGVLHLQIKFLSKQHSRSRATEIHDHKRSTHAWIPFLRVDVFQLSLYRNGRFRLWTERLVIGAHPETKSASFWYRGGTVHIFAIPSFVYFLLFFLFSCHLLGSSPWKVFRVRWDSAWGVCSRFQRCKRCSIRADDLHQPK